jgi:hypothetical protein
VTLTVAGSDVSVLVESTICFATPRATEQKLCAWDGDAGAAAAELATSSATATASVGRTSFTGSPFRG